MAGNMSHVIPQKRSPELLAWLLTSFNVDEVGDVVRLRSGRGANAGVAGWLDELGYRYIRVTECGKSKLVAAHHIAWFLHHGEWPTNSVDHINGDKSDNRKENLRLASHAENMRNLKSMAKSSGLPFGVVYHPQTGKYRVRIKAAGRSISLGLFDTVEAAREARVNGEITYHGAFAACLGSQRQEAYHR